MPIYNVFVRQWVEELAEKEIEADNEQQAREMAEDGEIDFTWYEGNDSQDLEVIKVDLINEPVEGEPGFAEYWLKKTGRMPEDDEDEKK